MNLPFTIFTFSNQDICAEHLSLMKIVNCELKIAFAGGKR